MTNVPLAASAAFRPPHTEQLRKASRTDLRYMVQPPKRNFMLLSKLIRLAVCVLTAWMLAFSGTGAQADEVSYKYASVDGIKIFYREAGDKSKPTLLLLHGFPSSSH